ncbi:unnamed protein product [Effrenium voratum]|uniref:Uncharacterized protein n=1 Tax=Effrenium voratum TaxID=2562239 RepID=A0AA36MNG8_9DINO|nr:unnamed protein product [Effrenium voratum]CAJ1446783.1 unnamed protein product [Effrenium voratum]
MDQDQRETGSAGTSGEKEAFLSSSWTCSWCNEAEAFEMQRLGGAGRIFELPYARSLAPHVTAACAKDALGLSSCAKSIGARCSARRKTQARQSHPYSARSWSCTIQLHTFEA